MGKSDKLRQNVATFCVTWANHATIEKRKAIAFAYLPVNKDSSSM